MKRMYRCPDITRMGMCPFTGIECPIHMERCPDRPSSERTQTLATKVKNDV